MLDLAAGIIGLGLALLFFFWVLSLFVHTVTSAFKPPPPQRSWEGGPWSHRVGGRRVIGRSIDMEDVPLLEEEEPF